MQAHSEKITALVRWLVTLSAVLLLGCPPEPPTDPRPELVKRGEALFFNETFGGNGRTCGTCHPAENNFTIDPAVIASLPDDNPLFVAEFNPDLSENFEKPKLMRQFGLILENLDGFGNLENDFVLRGVPHTLGLTHTVESPQGPRTGWSGDGAPGDGTLRDFATGAVTQHFTKTLNRVRDVDFRLPTDDELDALEAFQLTIGRQEELTLPLSFRNEVVQNEARKSSSTLPSASATSATPTQVPTPSSAVRTWAMPTSIPVSRIFPISPRASAGRVFPSMTDLAIPATELSTRPRWWRRRTRRRFFTTMLST